MDRIKKLFKKNGDPKANGQNKEIPKPLHQELLADPTDEKGFLKKGLALYLFGKPVEAIECFNKAIALNSNYSEAFYQKGTVLHEVGKSSEAMKSLDIAILLNPKYAEAFNTKGNALSHLGNNNEAIKCYDKAISIYPDYADAFYNKGMSLSELGKKEEAIECYNKTISLNPNDPSVYNSKGVALRDLGRNEEAFECFEKAISLDPNYTIAFNNKAIALRSLGKHQEAIEIFDKVISLNQNSGPAYNNKGSTLFNLGKKEEAIECFDKAISINPNYATAYNNKGISLYGLGKTEEALKCYNKAIALNPNYALFLCNRGQALSFQGRTEDSLADFSKASRLMKKEKSGNKNGGDPIFMKKSLKLIVKLQNIALKTNSVAQKLDKKKLVPEELMASLKRTHEDKNKITKRVIESYYKKDEKIDNKEEIKKLEKIIKHFKDLNQDLIKIQEEASKSILHLSEVFDLKPFNDSGVIEGTNENEAIDYNELLKVELSKTEFSEDEIKKIKEYFDSFTFTFISVVAFPPIINAEEINLNLLNNKMRLLSTIASFSDYIGDELLFKIEPINSFLKNQKIQTIENKIKKLTKDSEEFIKIIDKSAYKIVLDPKKQKQIIELQGNRESFNELFKKIDRFCRNKTNKLHPSLYADAYRTSSSQLGNEDANRLMHAWFSRHFDSSHIVEKFVELAIYDDNQKVSKPIDKLPDSHSAGAKPAQEHKQVKERSQKCCNVFSMVGITYDNPILNHSAILKKYSSTYGERATSNLISVTSQFSDNAKSILEQICSKPNSVLILELIARTASQKPN